ncbi:helix-turn-helix domain-containing protein [Variovorax sp. J22R193]|uniref:helix-turn-helix domain-containing protein n=1 Tax=Variovorax fucosicus TaxID=3053517 RepID=UPI00257664CB|nr:helix-turn-helix domain-containing protein [Variovorax sp. J22R193]MDM0041867.1 helix-turn-helix domain-containing protein [Variovorax sp. J22R193]
MATRKAAAKPPARKPGRPSKYKEEFAEQARKLCLLGATDKDLGNFFEVSEQTVNTWKIEHPAFLESLKAGKQMADAEVARSLFERATGYSHKAVKILVVDKEVRHEEYVEHYPPDATSMIFWLKNRRPDLWRGNPEDGGTDDPAPPQKVVIEIQDGRRAPA